MASESSFIAALLTAWVKYVYSSCCADVGVSADAAELVPHAIAIANQEAVNTVKKKLDRPVAKVKSSGAIHRFRATPTQIIKDPTVTNTQ